MTTRYFDPRLQKKQFLDGEYETGPGYNSSQTELLDPSGSDTLTYKTTKTHIDPSGQYYEDPFKDIYNLPENQTYISPSLAPKSGFKDPNAPKPYDIDPLDWKMGNTLNSERNQRSIVRQYVAQKYAKAADPEGVNNANEYAQKMNTIGNVGHALDRMFTSASVAHKGPGADASFWSGLKQQGQQAVQSSENDRRAKIEDFLAQKKLGSEGVKELSDMRKLDREAALDNPTSEISQQYQTLFAKQYPEYRDQIMNMPARDLVEYMKAVEEQKRSQIDDQYRKDSMSLKREELNFQKDKMGAEQKYQEDLSSYRDRIADAKEQQIRGGNTQTQPSGDGFKAPEKVKLQLSKEYDSESGPVYTDDYGNFYDFNRKLISDPKTLKIREAQNTKHPTVEQGKAASFWDRAERAQVNLNSLEEKGYTAPKSAMSQYAIETYMMSDGVMRQISKKALDNDDIMYANSAMSFLNSILRKDSGAAIPKYEYAKYKYMLPESGDSVDVLEQKRIERENMVNALASEAGPNVIENIKKGRVDPKKPEPKPSGKKPAPTVGTIEGGYEFMGGDPSNPKSWRKVQ